jgi:hypothetical protein
MNNQTSRDGRLAKGATGKCVLHLTVHLEVTIALSLGHAVAQWLNHYATSQKVVGSRPDKETFFPQFT